MTQYRILVTESDRFSSAAKECLDRLGRVTFGDLDREQLLSSVPDAEVLWVRLRHMIDDQVLRAGRNLRFVATPTTGLNHIDLESAARRQVTVLSLRGETEFLRSIRATAEHTLGLMLSLIRNLPSAAEHVLGGGWDRDQFRGGELHEKTIGIVGYGRLGSLVAKYLSALDARVLACDPHVDPDSVADDVELVSLQSLLRQSDIVSLHVNLCDQTVGMLAAQQFEQMKPGAFLINTARGELVDEAALLDGLRRGRLSGAALDVLADEQSLTSQSCDLVRYAQEHRNLIITPHIGGCTTESMAKTEIFLAEKLCAALRESSVTA